MTKPDDIAFPIPETDFNHLAVGLNKLEYFASAVMTGLLSNIEIGNRASEAEISKLAVSHARHLIAELNKPCSTESKYEPKD